MTLLRQPVVLNHFGIRELLTLRVEPVPPSPKDLARWRSMAEQATPVPWTWNEGAWNDRIDKRYPKGQRLRDHFVYALQGVSHYQDPPGARWADPYEFPRVMWLRWSSIRGDELHHASPSPQDREFIAETRIAFPRVLDYVQFLEQENARLKEQIAGSNGTHDEGEDHDTHN
jgi:hypothetical protein